jgi:hypothetical protein
MFKTFLTSALALAVAAGINAAPTSGQGTKTGQGGKSGQGYKSGQGTKSGYTSRSSDTPSQTAGLLSPRNPFESQTSLTPDTQIDKLVLSKLKQLGIEPAKVCTDAVFLRRVYLDITGTLPTVQEAMAFLSERDTNKRSKLIDRLLERDEYADYWAMKWCDVLRVKAEFPINLWPNAAQAYHRWILDSLRKNVPYDQFVREMLTSNGSNFRVAPVNFYRAMQNREPAGIAQTVALTFMGTRAENWPKEQLTGMAGFFSQINYKSTGEWKEEIVMYDPNLVSNKVDEAVFPGGKKVRLPQDQDPRIIFADWLINPENPWFTRNIANRVWSWLLGRGIIHEADDVRPDNPPSNPELLAYLEKEMVAAKYDLKKFYRLILNSQTYQLSAVPKAKSPAAEANFAYYPLRRLEAEVLIDALNQITGTTEKYSSAIPEPFTFIPEDQRSIALPDGSISSAFLELFGRPPRNTGLEDERNNRPTPDQRLHMLNSSHIQRKLEQNKKFQTLMTSTKNPRDVVVGLYLMILSRFPTEQELNVITGYNQGGAKGRDGAVDIAWALVNSPEFLYRH